MSFKELGISRETIQQIESAYEKLYLKSRSLNATYEQQEIVLNKLIEDLVENAFERVVAEDSEIKGTNSELVDLRDKILIEIRRMIEKNRSRLDNEAGYLKLDSAQSNAEFMLQYEVENNLMDETEPSLEFIINCLKQMNGETNSICILSDKSFSYIQCAGSTERLTIEYRKYTGKKFKHYVIGFKKFFKSRTTIYFSSREISLKSNEVFCLDNAIEIFKNFYLKQEIPKEHQLRNITNKMI